MIKKKKNISFLKRQFMIAKRRVVVLGCQNISFFGNAKCYFWSSNTDNCYLKRLFLAFTIVNNLVCGYYITYIFIEIKDPIVVNEVSVIYFQPQLHSGM